MNIEVLIEDSNWSENTDKWIKKATVAVFSFMKLKSEDIEICFLCTNDEEVKILNKTYRGIDKSTNVLSFPADSYVDDEDDYCDCDHCADEGCHGHCDCDGCEEAILGSVALALETIQKEAQEQEKSFENHLMHLVVHSVLHLLGYDHIEEEDAKKMEDLEINILKNIDIENPYL